MTHSGWRGLPGGRQLLAKLRQTCSELPEVEETIDGFDHTTFRVREKSFLIAGMGEDGQALSIKSDLPNQALLVERGPYYRTPYIGQHGWISIAAPLEHEWSEIARLIRDAWRLAAPKGLAKQLPAE